jgi:hypothetical protein
MFISRGNFMPGNNGSDPDLGGAGADDAQTMLILAYTRLFLLPEAPDGSKLTTIASFGSYDVRLIELPPNSHASLPLWIELYDQTAKQVVDSTGCRDLQEAGVATKAFVTQAELLNERASRAIPGPR